MKSYVLSLFVLLSTLFFTDTAQAQFQFKNKEIIKMMDAYHDYQGELDESQNIVMLTVLNYSFDKSLLQYDSLENILQEDGFIGEPLIILNTWQNYSIAEMPPHFITKGKEYDVYIYFESGGLFDYSLSETTIKKEAKRLKKKKHLRDNGSFTWILAEDNDDLIIQTKQKPVFFESMFSNK